MVGRCAARGFRHCPPRPTVRGMAPIPSSDAQPDDTPESYVGLDEAAAERRARSHGWTTVRSLPPGTIITLEFLAGRINFEVADSTVTRCWVG